MEVRVKTFVQEAASRPDFLRTDYGFTGPEVMHDQAGGYPLLRKVRYSRGDLAVEISLVLSYMGEEYVAATVVSGDTGPSGRTQIGSGTAHTGYQMRRALDRQAAAVRENTPRADASWSRLSTICGMRGLPLGLSDKRGCLMTPV